MKFQLFRLSDLKWCLLIVGIYAILFQIIERTRVIEKVMALTFSWWELILIVAFLVSRILTYLLVPSVLAAAAAYAILSGSQCKLSDPASKDRRKS